MTNNKKRLYFKCPLKAAYMAKEFGVKVNLFNSQTLPANENKLYKPNVPKSELYSEMIAYLQFCIDKNGKIYIAKESESIFEPLEGDKITKEGRIGFMRRNIDELSSLSPYTVLEMQDFEIEPMTETSSGKVEIIMRNNEHFFMAEVDDDK